MRKEATSNGKRGGNLVGKPHDDKDGNPVGGIKAVVTDAGGKPVELEGGEVIINKAASKKYWRELSKINQSAGNGVPIGPPIDPHDEDPEEYKAGGNIIDFNPNHIPNKWIVKYAESVKKNNPEVWKKGGNIFGNEAFENLLRVSKRGHWLDSEKWMYIKWRSYVARHKKDFRIEGVVAMLKWCDKVEKGWLYMKDLIETETQKPAKKTGWNAKVKQLKEGGIILRNGKQFIAEYGRYKTPQEELKVVEDNLNKAYEERSYSVQSAYERRIKQLKIIILENYSNEELQEKIDANKSNIEKRNDLISKEKSSARRKALKFANETSLRNIAFYEKYIREEPKMKTGGEVPNHSSNCNEFIKITESVLSNGYYHYFENTSIYTESTQKTPVIKSFYLITYNSGNQKDLKVTDTINSTLAVGIISKYIESTLHISRILISDFIKESRRLDTLDILSELKGQNVIIIDRDNIACSSKKDKSKMNEGGKVDNFKPSSELTAVLLNHLKKYSKEQYGEDIDDSSFMMKTIKKSDKHHAEELSATTKSGIDIHIKVEELYMKYGGELEKGVKTEMEHKQTIEKFKKEGVSDKQVAQSIAIDHLKEDPHYYTKLSQLEESFDKRGQTVEQQDKIRKVINEFKEGKLRTLYGEKVTEEKQAIAIALKEAGIEKMVKGGLIIETGTSKVKVGDTVLIKKGVSQRSVIITNITDKWVIFTDLEDGKRKDNSREQFLKNFISFSGVQQPSTITTTSGATIQTPSGSLKDDILALIGRILIEKISKQEFKIISIEEPNATEQKYTVSLIDDKTNDWEWFLLESQFQSIIEGTDGYLELKEVKFSPSSIPSIAGRTIIGTTSQNEYYIENQQFTGQNFIITVTQPPTVKFDLEFSIEETRQLVEGKQVQSFKLQPVSFVGRIIVDVENALEFDVVSQQNKMLEITLNVRNSNGLEFDLIFPNRILDEFIKSELEYAGYKVKPLIKKPVSSASKQAVSKSIEYNLEDLVQYETTTEAKKHSTVVLKWSEGLGIENVPIINSKQLQSILRQAGFPNEPTRTYFKNVIFFRYDSMSEWDEIKVDNGLQGEGFDPFNTDILTWSKKQNPDFYEVLKKLDEQFKQKTKPAPKSSNQHIKPEPFVPIQKIKNEPFNKDLDYVELFTTYLKTTSEGEITMRNLTTSIRETTSVYADVAKELDLIGEQTINELKSFVL